LLSGENITPVVSSIQQQTVENSEDDDNEELEEVIYEKKKIDDSDEEEKEEAEDNSYKKSETRLLSYDSVYNISSSLFNKLMRYFVFVPLFSISNQEI